MSIEAMIWVRKHAPVKGSAEMVILYSLADRANDDGTGCWPYYETIADEARCSLPTVKRHIKAMEERGLIVRGNQSMVAGYPPYRRPVVWNLNMDLRREEAKKGTEKAGYQNDTSQKRGINQSKVRYQSGQSEVSAGADRGVTGDTDNPPTTTQEPSNNLPSPLAPQGEVVEESKELAKPEPKAPATKGTRLVAGWMPSQGTIQKMQAQFPDMDFYAVHEEFTDYWIAAPGQKGVKVDWDATWRNWIRRAGNEGRYPKLQGQMVPPARSQPSRADQKAGWYMSKAEELAAEFAVEEGES